MWVGAFLENGNLASNLFFMAGARPSPKFWSAVSIHDFYSLGSKLVQRKSGAVDNKKAVYSPLARQFHCSLLV